MRLSNDTCSIVCSNSLSHWWVSTLQSKEPFLKCSIFFAVAVYVPAQKAFNSGIETDPVMCITTKSALKESCNWTTCGEWCLSKVSATHSWRVHKIKFQFESQGTGACLQIFVNLRQNGSSVQFQNCTNFVTKKCYGLDTEVAKNFTCIKEECKNLTGIFNCTKGVCHNITDVFECEFHNLDPVLKCSGRRGKVTCMEIHGLFSCNKGGCEKIKAPYNCDRRCRDIPTRNKNVILLSGDNVSFKLPTCNMAVWVTLSLTFLGVFIEMRHSIQCDVEGGSLERHGG